jgi:hypothetical protein
MSVEERIALKRAEIAVQAPKREAKGKFRKETIVERCGKWTIGWVIFWSVLAGVAWTTVYFKYPVAFESNTRTITIVNEAHADIEEATQEAKIEVAVVDEIETIANDIYKLESSNGVNNYSKCEAIGKVNGIGYGIPGNGKYMCFEDHAEEMTVLKGWITEKRARGLSDTELLCLYSGNNYKICK